MPPTLKFAIIGCGRIAQRHAEHIQTCGKLVAVCDIVKERAEKLALAYAAPFYISLDELLAAALPIDILVICTPNGLHAQQSIAALYAGYHVLVEKPMALHVKDCAAMLQAVETTGKRLFTIQQNRFNPPVITVKELLDKKALGIIYSIQLTCFWNRNAAYYTADAWRGTKALDGGTLFTQFSHFIDLLLWLFGDVTTVRSITKNSAHKGIIEFEDNGVVLLEFENGIIGTINYSVNSYNKNLEGSLVILSENGSVKIGGEYLNTIDYQHIKGHDITVQAFSNTANDYGSYKGSMSNHGEVYKNLVNALQNGSPYYTDPSQSMKTVALIERIYQSANENNV